MDNEELRKLVEQHLWKDESEKPALIAHYGAMGFDKTQLIRHYTERLNTEMTKLQADEHRLSIYLRGLDAAQSM